MSDRITPAMITGSTLNDINAALAAMERSASELSSGKTILSPSDNPYGAGHAIDLQSQLDGLSSYSTSIQDGISWEKTSTGAMSNVFTTVQRGHDRPRDRRGRVGRREHRYLLAARQRESVGRRKAAVDAAHHRRTHARGHRRRQAALASTDLKAVDASLETLTQLQAVAGSATTQLQTAAARIEQLQATSRRASRAPSTPTSRRRRSRTPTSRPPTRPPFGAGASIVQESLLNFLR